MDSELKQSEEILPRKFGRRAILILIGLVMHFHGVYGLLAVVNDYVLPVAVSMSVAVVSISIMSFEDTLGNILAFETADAPGESRRHGFCCGAFDNDLIYFCGYPCHARLCCHRRVYFARLFYYNLNAFLVAAAWFGLDVNRAIVTERIVGSDLIGRIWMDIFYLFLSNVVLMYNHELMGQFGVVGDKAVLQFHDEPAPESVDADPDLSYSPMADTIPISPSERITKSASRESLGALNLSSTLEANLLNYSEAKPGLLLSAWNRYSKRLKIIIVFLALTMFWTATWDLLCSIPSQEMVGTEGDDGDDDYYDVHVKGRSDEEFLLLIWGLAYSVVAIVFMIITGELFSVVKRQDSTSEKIRLYFKEKLCCRCSLGDTEWNLGKVKFFPIRLISYNVKGSMSVIGWAGLSMIISSIERNIIYNINYSVERRIATQLSWILCANVILIVNNDFGLQYGGSDHLASKHEILAIDMRPKAKASRLINVEGSIERTNT